MRRPGTWRSIGVLIAVALGGAVTACSVVFGFDGFAADGDAISDEAGLADGGGPGATGDGTTPDPVEPFHGVACASATASGVCLPPVPNGWDGPVILFEGAVDGGVPSCPGASLPVAKGLGGLDAGDATCAACSCSPGTATCSAPSVVPESFPFGCSGSATDLTPGQCVALGGGFGFGSTAAVGGSTPAGGCTAAGGEATVPPATWSASAEACNAIEVPTATCPSGQTCREAPPGGFVAGKYCVYTQDSYACPRGSVYTDRHEIDDGPLSDDRGCRACDCDVKGGQCDTSALQVAFFGSTNCSGDAGKTLSVPATCQGTGTAKSARLNQGAALTAPPTCSVHQGSGAPRGSARTSKTWTICCTN